jgi:hypothetical protein
MKLAQRLTANRRLSDLKTSIFPPFIPIQVSFATFGIQTFSSPRLVIKTPSFPFCLSFVSLPSCKPTSRLFATPLTETLLVHSRWVRCKYSFEWSSCNPFLKNNRPFIVPSIHFALTTSQNITTRIVIITEMILIKLLLNCWPINAEERPNVPTLN